MVNKPNSITIDLSALVHNLGQIRTLAGKGVRIMGVVKADAYGHGLLPVSQTLEKDNIDCLGVAYLHEAVELRRSGIRTPIVILGGIQTREEAREVVEKDLTPVLYNLTSAEVLARESEQQGKKTAIHLKVDTGMGRLGISYTEIGPFIQRISTLKSLDLEALTSHLSSADRSDDDFTNTQIKRFKEAVEAARSQGCHLLFNSLANSAGIMSHQGARFEMVRPGISLYGGLPSPEFSCPVSLRPVMSFKGRVLQIRDLPDRTPVSYGQTFYTNGPRRIAILSTGYADGLPRSMSNAGNVLIRGKKAPIVGMICMNLTATDITSIKDAEAGDEAVFLGSQGGQTITGDDVARSADTISYEVFCSLGLRNTKEYLS
jgi:alanine racemase